MKGITPIIAVIILLLITVAAAGAAFIWIQIVQNQVSQESQSGLTRNLMQMHGRLSIESVWNETERICMIIRNSGSNTYEASYLEEIGIYIGNEPYQINTTTITSALPAQSSMVLCLCTEAGAGSGNCAGALEQGYDYDGETIDITLTPPVGTGDTYNNYKST